MTSLNPDHVTMVGTNNLRRYGYMASAADGGGNRGSLPRAPSVRGPPNSPELVQILAVSDRKVRRTGIAVDCAV